MQQIVDAIDLKTAIEFVKKNTPKQIHVDIKGWVRIRRDISQLHPAKPTTYTMVPREDKWLWHMAKGQMRLAKIEIRGVSVVRIR